MIKNENSLKKFTKFSPISVFKFHQSQTPLFNQFKPLELSESRERGKKFLNTVSSRMKSKVKFGIYETSCKNCHWLPQLQSTLDSHMTLRHQSTKRRMFLFNEREIFIEMVIDWAIDWLCSYSCDMRKKSC
jgi:hypothetical protein